MLNKKLLLTIFFLLSVISLGHSTLRDEELQEIHDKGEQPHFKEPTEIEEQLTSESDEFIQHVQHGLDVIRESLREQIIEPTSLEGSQEPDTFNIFREVPSLSAVPEKKFPNNTIQRYLNIIDQQLAVIDDLLFTMKECPFTDK